jgi:hypothetical protein
MEEDGRIGAARPELRATRQELRATSHERHRVRALVHTIRVMVVRSLLGAFLIVLGVAAPALGQDAGDCAERFPEVTWLRLDTPVDVYAAGVPVGHADRYAGEINGAVDQIVEHFGSFDATVCLFAPDSAFDTSRFVSGSDRLHALLLTDDALLILSTENVGLTGSAAAFGLAHIAMWQYSGGVGFPESQASTIAQYFRSEVRDRAVYDHAEAKASNFFGPEVVTPWSYARQADPLAWDPGAGRSSFGAGTGPASDAASAASTHMADLVRFGMQEEGEEIFTNTDPAMWTDLESRWRDALTAEMMGTDEPTTGWRTGLAFAVGIVVAAAVAVTLGFISKRRGRQRPETPEPIPGFFDATATPAN